MAGGLGFIYSEDARDWQLHQIIPIQATSVNYRYHKHKGILDQGYTPQCTAYAAVSVYMGSPVRNGYIDPSPIYHAAQLVDEWEGEGYDGTSVRAAMKICVERGMFTGYAFGTDINVSNNYVLLHAPVINATPWYVSMDDPDAEGIIRVHESSGIRGYHAYVKDGVNMKRGMSRFRQSWGTNYGKRGMFWMAMEDEEKLLTHDSHFCTPVEI